MTRFNDSIEAKRYAVNALRKLAQTIKELGIELYYFDDDRILSIEIGEWEQLASASMEDAPESWEELLEDMADNIKEELHDDCDHQWFFVEDETNFVNEPTGRFLYKCALCNTIKITKPTPEGEPK